MGSSLENYVGIKAGGFVAHVQETRQIKEYRGMRPWDFSGNSFPSRLSLFFLDRYPFVAFSKLFTRENGIFPNRFFLLPP